MRPASGIDSPSFSQSNGQTDRQSSLERYNDTELDEDGDRDRKAGPERDRGS